MTSTSPSACGITTAGSVVQVVAARSGRRRPSSSSRTSGLFWISTCALLAGVVGEPRQGQLLGAGVAARSRRTGLEHEHLEPGDGQVGRRRPASCGPRRRRPRPRARAARTATGGAVLGVTVSSWRRSGLAACTVQPIARVRRTSRTWAAAVGATLSRPRECGRSAPSGVDSGAPGCELAGSLTRVAAVTRLPIPQSIAALPRRKHVPVSIRPRRGQAAGADQCRGRSAWPHAASDDDGGGGGGSDDPIVIGTSLPLTGEFSQPGTAAQQGYKVWQEMVNADGGLLGREVKLVIKDDASNQNTIVTDYNALISQDKVDLLLGHLLLAAQPAGLGGRREQPDALRRARRWLAGHVQPRLQVPLLRPAGDRRQAGQGLRRVGRRTCPSDQRPKTAAYPTLDDPFAAPNVEGIRADPRGRRHQDGLQGDLRDRHQELRHASSPR